jgi:hypothetical protein
MTIAGHSAQDPTAENFENLSPQYLREAIAAIDAHFGEIATLAQAQLPGQRDGIFASFSSDRAASSPIPRIGFGRGWWS